MMRLRVETDSAAETAVEIPQGTSILGRSRTTIVPLSDPDVSREHAKLTCTGEIVSIENLSRHGTMLNGSKLCARTELHDGDRIALGNAAMLIVELTGTDEQECPTITPAVETCVPDPDTYVAEDRLFTVTQEDEPVVNTDDDEVMAQGDCVNDVTIVPDSSGDECADVETADNAPEPTLPIMGHVDRDGMDPGTSCDDTIIVNDEEIDHMRERSTKVLSLRRLAAAGAAVVIAAVLGLYMMFRPRTDGPLKWPHTEDGQFLEASLPSRHDGLWVIYPGLSSTTVRSTEDGAVIMSRLSGVPFRQVLTEIVRDAFVFMDRDDVIRVWQDELRAEDSTWRFERSLSMPLFIGGDGGVPVTCIPCARGGQDGWAGMATVLRRGRRLTVLLAEVPASSRFRADELMFSLYLEPSREFVEAYWEGSSRRSPVPPHLLLRQAEELLDRFSPSTWRLAESTIIHVLQYAVESGMDHLEKRAERRLVRLRRLQSVWFRNQQLEKMAVEIRNDHVAADTLARRNFAVFTSPRDRRFYTVREWGISE